MTVCGRAKVFKVVFSSPGLQGLAPGTFRAWKIELIVTKVTGDWLESVWHQKVHSGVYTSGFPTSDEIRLFRQSGHMAEDTELACQAPWTTATCFGHGVTWSRGKARMSEQRPEQFAGVCPDDLSSTPEDEAKAFLTLRIVPFLIS